MRARLIVLAVLFVGAAASSARAQSTANPTNALGIDIAAADVPTAAGYTWRMYLDSSTTGSTIAGVTCAASATAGVQTCRLPWPALTTGTHTVQVTAANGAGESPKSVSFSFPFENQPSTPTNPRIVK